MSTVHGGPGNIVTSGLVLNLDAANPRSYPPPYNGTTWTDLSRNGNNGVLTNGPVFNSTNGGVFVFDNVNDYVDMGDKDVFTPVNGFTFDLWFRPSVLSSNTIVEKYQSGGFEYIFGIGGANLFGWVYQSSNASYRGRFISTTSSFLQVNQWAHLIFLYEGGTLTTNVKIYINSIQRDDSNFTNGTFTSMQNTPTNLTISRNTIGTGNSIGGSLGSVKMYNRALTTAEVLQNYNATRARFGI